MKNQTHALQPIWKKVGSIFSTEQNDSPAADIAARLSEVLVIGEFYYYLIDIHTQALTMQHPKLCTIHGLQQVPDHLQQVIELIHPDDMEFVLRAEEACYSEVAIEKHSIAQIKSSYCFRMLVADGSYHLFHHQAITIVVDKWNRIVKSLNIHTDIQHISGTNSYLAYLLGINGLKYFRQFDLSHLRNEHADTLRITKREHTVLRLLTEGSCSKKIALQLGISLETVRVHRKNLLKKTGMPNTAALIRRCSELGVLRSDKS